MDRNTRRRAPTHEPTYALAQGGDGEYRNLLRAIILCLDGEAGSVGLLADSLLIAVQ